MPYEKTIARDHKIYELDITTSYQTVYDTISNATNKTELTALKESQEVVDGYIIPAANCEVAHSSNPNDANDFITATADEATYFPVLGWDTKTYIKSTGATTARLVLYFS